MGGLFSGIGSLFGPVGTVVGGLIDSATGSSGGSGGGGGSPAAAAPSSGLDAGTIMKIYELFKGDKPADPGTLSWPTAVTQGQQVPGAGQQLTAANTYAANTGANDPLHGVISQEQSAYNNLGANAPDFNQQFNNINAQPTGFGSDWLQAQRDNAMTDYKNALAIGMKQSNAAAAASGIGGGAEMNANNLAMAKAMEQYGTSVNNATISNAQQAAIDRQAHIGDINSLLGMESSYGLGKASAGNQLLANMGQMTNDTTNNLATSANNYGNVAKTNQEGITESLAVQTGALDKYKIDMDSWSKMFSAIGAMGANGKAGALPTSVGTNPYTGAANTAMQMPGDVTVGTVDATTVYNPGQDVLTPGYSTGTSYDPGQDQLSPSSGYDLSYWDDILNGGDY